MSRTPNCSQRLVWYGRGHHLAAGGIFALLLLAHPHNVCCQPPAQQQQQQQTPFSPPFTWDAGQTLLDQLLGGTATQDQQALEQVEVSVGEERHLGERAFATYRNQLQSRGIALSSRGQDVRYVQQLVATVRPLMQHPQRYPRIKVFIATAELPEARCFPGGSIVVFRGLLELADSEAALVGVVGHELSHLDHGHQLVPLRRVKLAAESFAKGAREGVSPQLFLTDGALLLRLFARPFRPEDEAQADADGAEWAYRLGYDPREMAALFRRMSAHRSRPEIGISFLRSHPFDEQRHQAVLQRFRDLTTAAPQPRLYTGRENLSRRIPRSHREFDE